MIFLTLSKTGKIARKTDLFPQSSVDCGEGSTTWNIIYWPWTSHHHPTLAILTCVKIRRKNQPHHCFNSMLGKSKTASHHNFADQGLDSLDNILFSRKNPQFCIVLIVRLLSKFFWRFDEGEIYRAIKWWWPRTILQNWNHYHPV